MQPQHGHPTPETSEGTATRGHTCRTVLGVVLDEWTERYRLHTKMCEHYFRVALTHAGISNGPGNLLVTVTVKTN